MISHRVMFLLFKCGPKRTKIRRIDPRRPLLLLAGGLFLSGCATLGALTLPEVRGAPEHTLRLNYTQCTSLQDTAEVIVGPSVLIGHIYEIGRSAFKSYIEQKASRFTRQYAVTATLDEISPGRCLRVQRIDPADGQVLMDLIMEIGGRGTNSVEIVPRHLAIQQFAASAAPDDGELKARITLSLGVSFVNENMRFGTDPITALNIPIGTTIYSIGPNGTKPLEAFAGQRSKLFPALRNQPVNVAIMIAEVGNGSEIFNDALASFDKNADALEDLLGGLMGR